MPLSKHALINRLLTLSALPFIILTHAITPPPTVYPGCGILLNTIYCFGGGQIEASLDFIPSNGFFSFNITNAIDTRHNFSSWEKIVTSGDVQPEPNGAMSFYAIPKYNRLVVDGGAGYNNGTGLTHRTIVFDALTVEWSEIQPSQSPQIYYGTTVLGKQTGSKLYLWGGESDFYSGLARNETEYSTDMRILDMETLTWAVGGPPPSTIGSFLQGAGILGKDGRSIYYIGGISANVTVDLGSNASTSYLNNPLNTIYMYDTVSGIWDVRNTTNAAIPAPRIRHTLSLTSAGKVLLYGGLDPLSTAAAPLLDYLYTLDTDTMVWDPVYQYVNTTEYEGAGPRWGHSAVMADDYTLFVIFGCSSQGYKNDINILDTRSWTWTYTYQGLHAALGDNSTSKNNTSSGGPSGGVIAGITIGVVAGLSIVIGIIVFLFLRRKRKQQRNTDGEIYTHTEVTHDTNEAGSIKLVFAAQNNGTRTKPDIAVGRIKPDIVEDSKRRLLQSVKPDGH